MNTRIHYLYRDACNNKQDMTIVVAGELRWADLPLLDEGEYFTPEDVGLPHPGPGFPTGDFPGPGDHCWCELGEEDITLTDEKPTIPLRADELLERFRAAAAADWPAQTDSKYLAEA